MLAVVPDPATPELARTLDLGGYSWKAVGSIGDATAVEPADGWAGIVIDVASDPENAWSFLRSIRRPADRVVPVLVLIGGGQLSDLQHRDDLFDDFSITEK